MARAKNIKWVNKAIHELFSIADYIEQEFGAENAGKFVLKTQQKAELLSNYPEIGRPSKRFKTIRFVLVGKHHRMYYRIQGANLFIVYLFDTRQDPAKNRYR